MNEVSILITLATVHFIALMSPGPDFALVVQNATRFGRQTGIYIALGLSLGILTHAIFSVTGVSYIVHQHPTLFALLKGAGGSYLLYLGLGALFATWKHWRVPSASIVADNAMMLANKRLAFCRGFMTNLLNPKALVFFISLMSSLVPVGMSTAGKSAALIIIWGLSFTWFAMLAWLLTRPTMQSGLRKISRYIDLLCGVVFTLLGATILYQLVMINFVMT